MDGEHPEWLPADWKVCVRVRSSGKKDKYYINPSSDLKFNSKPEVLRYLKNAAKDLKLNDLKKINFKKTLAEKLPSGWIKEIRIKRKGGKTRREPYYIDPVSGRHFRSMQEVNCYIETKDSGKAESKGDDPDHTNEELEDHSKYSTAGAKGQRLIDKKVDKIFTGNESVKSEGAAVENINPPEANALVQREKDSVAEDWKQEKVAFRNKRKKLNSKWMNGLPRRTSKRLARVEADPPLEVKTSNGAREAARLTDEEAEVNATENIGKAKLSGETEINTSEDFGKQKEATDLPLRDLSSLEEHEAVGVEFKEDEKKEKHLDSSLNDLLMDPCIEFAIKTLTGAIPIEDVNTVHESQVDSLASPNQTSGSSSVLPGSSSVLPFGDIWADPCFEFAVKTLTSEIPMEDGSPFQISFQQPLSSSGASGCNSITK